MVTERLREISGWPRVCARTLVGLPWHTVSPVNETGNEAD